MSKRGVRMVSPLVSIGELLGVNLEPKTRAVMTEVFLSSEPPGIRGNSFSKLYRFLPNPLNSSFICHREI
jgi:hypothetical protein